MIWPLLTSTLTTLGLLVAGISFDLVKPQPALSHVGLTDTTGCHELGKPYHCHRVFEASGDIKPKNQKQSKKLTETGKSDKTVIPGKYARSNWSYSSYYARKRLQCDFTEHVDHVVALKEAYDSGAADWPRALKKIFANDPINQICLDAKLNISKSDKDLAEWSGGDCDLRKQIAKITKKVKSKYNLEIDLAERQAINQPCN